MVVWDPALHQTAKALDTWFSLKCVSCLGFPGGASGKEPTCQCRRPRDTGLIPELGRSPGGGHGNPLHYSYLENPMDRGAWRAIVHGVAKCWTRLNRLSTQMSCLVAELGPQPTWACLLFWRTWMMAKLPHWAVVGIICTPSESIL